MHGGISPDIRREREDQESGLYFGSQACRKLEWFLSVVTVEHLYGATSCILLTYLSVNGRPSGPVSIYWGAFGITFRVATQCLCVCFNFLGVPCQCGPAIKTCGCDPTWRCRFPEITSANLKGSSYIGQGGINNIRVLSDKGAEKWRVRWVLRVRNLLGVSGPKCVRAQSEFYLYHVAERDLDTVDVRCI
jgi:hypothetical protein